MIVAIAFFVGAWCVCLPLAYVFTNELHEVRALALAPAVAACPGSPAVVTRSCVHVWQGIFGLWLALVLGYVTITAICGVAVLRSDWVALAAQAQAVATSATSHPLVSPLPCDEGPVSESTALLQQ